MLIDIISWLSLGKVAELPRTNSIRMVSYTKAQRKDLAASEQYFYFPL